MANHNYIISEVQFFENKDDKKTRDFIKGVGIDLDSTCASKIPTILEIKSVLNDFKLEIEETLNDDSIEIVAKDESNHQFWLIFTDVESEDSKAKMFQIVRGSDLDLTIDFIKHLCKTHGKFLLYNDSGAMSLITSDKN